MLSPGRVAFHATGIFYRRTPLISILFPQPVQHHAKELQSRAAGGMFSGEVASLDDVEVLLSNREPLWTKVWSLIERG